MDKVEFAKIMAVLVAGTGSPKATPEQLDVYYETLRDLPLETLRTAALRALMDHKFPSLPPIGLIRQHAATVSGDLPSPIADAWASVKRFATRWEFWIIEGMPTYEKTLAEYRCDLAALPPIARQAATAYGWRAIIETETGVAFAHFRQLYESLDRPARQEAALPPSVRVPALAHRTNGIGVFPALENGHSSPGNVLPGPSKN